MRNCAKRIIAIALIAALTLSIFPNIGAARAEAASESGANVTGNVSASAASAEGEATAGFVSVEIDPDANTGAITWYGDARQMQVNFYEDGYEGTFDDERPVYQKSVSVSPSLDAPVTTNLTFDADMPEYFILEVLLQDASGTNTADPYLSNAYSEKIREVSEKTADDYRHKGDRLVELAVNSGADKGSFMILADDVLRIEEGAGASEGAEGGSGVEIDFIPANSGDSVCSLNHIDSKLSGQLRNLKEDAPVFLIDETTNAEGDPTTGYYMFSVDSVNVDAASDSAVLRGEVHDSLDENKEPDVEALRSFLTAINLNASQEYNVPLDSIPLGTWGTLSMNMKGTLTVSLTGNFSWTGAEFAFSIVNDLHCPDTELNVDLPTVTKDFPILTIPIIVTGVVNLEYNTSFRISGTATGGIRFDISICTGIEIGGRMGLTGLDLFVNNKSTMPKTDFRGFSIQGSVFVGFASGLSLSCFKVFSVSAELETGLEVSGKLTSGHYFDEKRKYHACKDFQCIDGDLSYKMLGYSVSVNAGVFNKGISGKFRPTIPLTPFYYSGTYNDSAATTCPHWGYRLFVHVTDQNQRPLKDAEVSYKIDDKQFDSIKSGKTDAEGKAVIYLPAGTHTITVSAKDETGHAYQTTEEFEEKGYDDNDKLIQEHLYVAIDMTRYTISFVDSDTSGSPAVGMPDAIYAYPDQKTAKIPGVRPTKTGRFFRGWSTEPNPSKSEYLPEEPITVERDTTLYAVWAYDKYYIHFDKNKPGNASYDVENMMQEKEVTLSEGIILPKNSYTLTGWEFKGWNTEPDGSGNFYADKATVPEKDFGYGLKEHITLYAQWEPKTYKVTFESGEEAIGETMTQEMEYDTSETLDPCNFTKENSIFTHWSRKGGLGSHYSDKAMVTNLCTVNKETGELQGHILTANWREANGAVIVVTNDGAMVDLDADEIKLKALNGTVEYQDAFEGESGIYAIKENTAVPSDTYEVLFDPETGYDAKGRTIEVEQNENTYNFDFCTVTISGDAHADSWIGSEGQLRAEKILIGEQIAIETDVKPGYHFEGYTAVGSEPGFEKDDRTKLNQTITVTGPVKLQAHSAANHYQIVFHANDGETDRTVTQDMVYDQEEMLIANQFERRGYQFAGWTKTEDWKQNCDYTDSQKVKNLTTENGKVLDLYGQWNPVRTFIQFDSNGGEGSMIQQETFYESRTTLKECEFTRDYWQFVGWNTEPDGSGIFYPDGAEFVSDKAEDGTTLTLYAQWEMEEYAITYDLAGGTILGENPEVYTVGTESFTLKEPQRTGYLFLGWTGSNGTVPEKTVTIPKGSHGDRAYTANWKPEIKTFTFDPNGGAWEDGTTAAVIKQAEYDSFITLPDAPSREYYTFEWWEDAYGHKHNPGYACKVTEDETFKALWNPIQYSITYELAGGTLEEENPHVYTTETEDFTLNNPSKEGYLFLGWTGSNGETPEKTVTVSKGTGGDRHYTANWSPVQADPKENGKRTDRFVEESREAADPAPATGDSFTLAIWGILLLVSAAVLAALLYGRMRKNR